MQERLAAERCGYHTKHEKRLKSVIGHLQLTHQLQWIAMTHHWTSQTPWKQCVLCLARPHLLRFTGCFNGV